jgi:hypothetical protein
MSDKKLPGETAFDIYCGVKKATLQFSALQRLEREAWAAIEKHFAPTTDISRSFVDDDGDGDEENKA